jgi:hypothetical protein
MEFEKIAAVLGNDVNAWGNRIEFGSSTVLTVSQIRLGEISLPIVSKTTIQIIDDNGEVKTTEAVNELVADGWSRTGFTMSSDFKATFKTDAILEITFLSESGKVWLVFPNAESGWIRLDSLDYIIKGNKCYIDFAKIATVLGDDINKWGDRIEFESNDSLKVTTVAVGTVEIPSEENPELPMGIIARMNQTNTSYIVEMTQYLSDYQPGDKVTITVEMESDANFNGCIGGNTVEAAGWEQQGLESVDNKATVVWTVTPDGNPSISLWWAGSETGVKINSIEVKKDI